MKYGEDPFFEDDEFLGLLSEYEQAVNTGMPVFLDADELTDIADYYLLKERSDDAEKAISLALEQEPDAVAPLSFKIREALYNADVELAKTYFNRIKDTDDLEYVYDKAEILIAEGKADEANEYLRQEFSKIPPEEQQDYLIDVAGIFSDYAYSEKAMEWMAQARQENTPDFKELKARTLFGLGKYNDSARLFNELIDTDPFSQRYWNGLASAQFMNEDYSEAVQSSEFAIAIAPDDPESIFAKANGLYRLGNFEEALTYYQRYDELEPDDEFSLLNQGNCYINLGNNREARQVLERAVCVAPEDSPYLCDIYQELAFCLSDDGETDLALDYLNKTDAMDCDHVQMLIIKGHLLLAAGRLNESEDRFRQAMELSDNSPKTMMRIIVSLYDNHYLQGSYTMFQKFFKGVPHDYNEGYSYMALICYDMKKYDEFLHYLKEACQRNPKECKLVLGHLFPKDMEPAKYYDYINSRIK